MALLEVNDLRTAFRTRQGRVRAVDGVSFRLQAAETLGLVGESGCGKSVTALSILRLLRMPPAEINGGEVRFDGRDLLRLPTRDLRKVRGSEIAMIFQDPMTSLNPVLTIGRHITEPLRQHLRMSRAQARERAIELLRLVGIPSPEARLRDYPHQFSGGMRQRVMIAMALSCNPKLLLADEITTALDVTIQAQILDLLRDLAREFGTACILISHDLGVVAGMTQRVHVMYAGQIVEKASTTALFDNPKMPYTWGLLRSTARLDRPRNERLIPIEGFPPNLAAPPGGCRFEPRCQYRRAICREREPELLAVSKADPGHEARCWGTQPVPGGGWLVDVDWRHEVGDEGTLNQIRKEAEHTAAELPAIEDSVGGNEPIHELP